MFKSFYGIIFNKRTMVPIMTKKNIYYILLALGLSFSVCFGSQAIVVEDSLMVTDVTPVQFCVVWTTSEPATGWVSLFATSGIAG